VTTAVLVTCHGTVDRVEDIPAFVTNIRRGHAAPAEVVQEVTRRFEKIGGSPLMRITRQQGAALEARLGIPVRVAGRLWHPYPKDVIAELYAGGVRKLVSLPLAPQSVHVYHAAVREGSSGLEGLDLRCAPAWGLEPALIDAFVETIDEGMARFPEGERGSVTVLLTAHSLPKRIVDAGDPYERSFRDMCSVVSERLAARGVASEVAFQSQGMTGDVWLGPDLATAFTGKRRVLIAPIGFVADHVETLYDLDIEAPEIARRAGVERLERAPAVNARPRFIDALEAVVRREV
jgi:ferrochelatase